LGKEVKKYSNIDCFYVSNRIVVGKHLKNKRYLNAIFALLKHLIYRIKLFLVVYLGMIRKPQFVVLLHQQYIGLKICEKIINKRGRNTFLYLLDSGFFCIRSYNHINGETNSCIKCLGGKYNNIDAMGCKPAPINDPYFKTFLINLQSYANDLRVSFLTQNQKQTNLVQSHFGDKVNVKRIGLWTSDLPKFDNIFRIRQKIFDEKYILYHGAPISPKGVYYSLNLAEKCSDIKFIFPFDKSEISYSNIPENCEFRAMTWDTGLKNILMNARIVLVPSLWSAPIESALIKSIMLARAVCVVVEETAFSSEINNGIIIKLSKNINQGAQQLRKMYKEKWKPKDEDLNAWLQTHWRNNGFPVKRIINSI